MQINAQSFLTIQEQTIFAEYAILISVKRGKGKERNKGKSPDNQLCPS